MALEIGSRPTPKNSSPSVTWSWRPPVIVTIIGVPLERDSRVERPNPSASKTQHVTSAILYIAAKSVASTLFLENITSPLVRPSSLMIASRSWPCTSLVSVCIIRTALSCPTLSRNVLNHQIRLPDCFRRALRLFQKTTNLSSKPLSFLHCWTVSSACGLKTFPSTACGRYVESTSGATVCTISYVSFEIQATWSFDL